MPNPATSASAVAAPRSPADSPAAARGRRILSTAFVGVGPGGHLTVELSDGRVLILRDVIMRRTDYCGVQIVGDPKQAKYCGGYAEVTAASPGGVPQFEQPDLAAPNPARAQQHK